MFFDIFNDQKDAQLRGNASVSNSWLPLLILTVIAIAIVCGWLRYVDQSEPKAPVHLSVPAKAAPEVKKVATVEKPIKAKTVKVYPAAVKNNLKLPELAQENPALDVIASHQVKADDHPQTITTLINTDTGESETYVKRDPLPWLAWEQRGEAGISLGLKNGEPAVRLEARQNMIQVKAVHFGATGSVDQKLNGASDTDWYLGVGAWYRW